MTEKMERKYDAKLEKILNDLSNDTLEDGLTMEEFGEVLRWLRDKCDERQS